MNLYWYSVVQLIISSILITDGFKGAFSGVRTSFNKNVYPQLEKRIPMIFSKEVKIVESKLDKVEEQRNESPKLLGKFVSWALKKVIRAYTEDVSGLEISVQDTSNLDVMRGNIKTLEMVFDKVAYYQLYVSGGGRILIKNLDLRMRRFLFHNSQAVRKPYALYYDFLLTPDDIVRSDLIRSWIQTLADTLIGYALGASSIFDVSVQKVMIRSNRVVAKGVVCIQRDARGYSGGTCVPFEVSTGMKMIEDGQIVHLKNLKVVLNPEKSLLRTEIPIVTTNPINIDLGDNCRIDSLVLSDHNIWIRGVTAISPVQPFMVAERKTEAFYHYDLSALLSEILKLNGGVAMKWMYN